MLTHHLLGTPVTFSVLVAEFVISTLCVVFFANKLSKYADALEKKAVISAVFIGTFFLAVVTSLPEAVTTIGAAIMEDALDLGVANLFGSSTLNLAIIIILDLIQGRGPLMLGVQSSLVLVAAGGIIITTLAGIAIGFHQHPAAEAWEGWLGPAFSLAILAAYVLLGRLTSQEHAIPNTAEIGETDHLAAVYNYSPLRIVTRLVLYAFLLIALSVWLLMVCDEMAVTPLRVAGSKILLGRTVVGTFLLSAATSFPELFVSIAALRLGQRNMAIANLLGSNMVNMLFVPLMHVAGRESVFYSRIDAASILILIAIMVLMSCIFILGVLVRSKKSFLLLGWDSIAMFMVYLTGSLLVLRLGLTL